MLQLPHRRVLMAGAAVVPAVFDPATLNLDMFVEISDIATLFQDSAHTVPVTAHLDPIGAMRDKGAAGGYFVQATAGKRPLYKTSGGSGIHAKTDGVDDTLVGSALSNYITNSVGDIMVAGVITTITTNSTSDPSLDDAMFADTGGGYVGLHFTTSAPNMRGYNYDTNVDQANANYTAGAPFVALWRHTGGNLTLILNNGTPVTVASGNTGQMTHALALGANWNNGVFTEMEFMAALARKTILDATELAHAWTYLGAKVGLLL